MVGPASRRSRRISGPSPTTTSGRPQPVEGAHRDVDPLVRHQLREHEVVLADPLGADRCEALDLHGRVQDGRLAAEVAAHAGGGEPRVGHVGVDALGGDVVPLAPAVEQQAQRRAHQRASGRAASPRARTRRTGTGCGSSRRAPRRDRRARRAPTRSRRRSRCRSRAGRATRSRAGTAAAAAGTCARSGRRRCRNERPRRAVGEPALGALLVVDGGEDVGLRPGVADRREHALGAAEVEQEVVDEGDAGGHGEPASLRRLGAQPVAARRLKDSSDAPSDPPPPRVPAAWPRCPPPRRPQRSVPRGLARRDRRRPA